MSGQRAKFPVAREGMIFILPLAGVTAALWSLRFPAVAGFFSFLTFFVIYFFRDPERTVPAATDAVLSPADGKVVRIEPCTEERFLHGPAIKISVFMSLFNVHVNRLPVSGRIVDQVYTPGKFIPANLDKASTDNEQNALLIETAAGKRLLIVQIAGIIARRIVCRPRIGDEVERGRRFGLIRFGSRLDVYLPEKSRIQAQPGQRTKAGQTILGYLS